MLPSVTMTGNLTAEPEIRFTQSGKPVCTFTVACNDRRPDPNNPGQYIDGDSCFLRVEVWGPPGENIVESLHRGDTVIVTGRLRGRQYEDKDGIKRTIFEVVGATVAAALTHATATVTRVRAGQQGQPPQAPVQPQPAAPAQAQQPVQPQQQPAQAPAPAAQPPVAQQQPVQPGGAPLGTKLYDF